MQEKLLPKDLHITLTKKPKGCKIIEGFPGFGLVATIATGFLVEHLKCEQIGKFYFPVSPAAVAIHNCKLVDPVGVFYNKKYNLVIIHSITNVAGMEYAAADLIIDVCKQLQVRELISIEGVGSQEIPQEPKAFYYCTSKTPIAELQKYGLKCLDEGIIIGSTGALLLKAPEEKIPLTCIFTETHSGLPDSKAAAKVIETLDKYLHLDVPYEPLLKQAQQFEERLKGVIDHQNRTKQLLSKADTNYVG